MLIKLPNKTYSKETLTEMHPGVCSKVYVESENAVYTFYKLGQSLPEGDAVEVSSPVAGTWVAST